VTLVAAVLFCYLANYPLAIGSNYGVPPDPDASTVAGTTISLIAAILIFIAAIYIRKLPVPLILFILVGVSVAILAPPIANGQGRWLGIMSASLGTPLLLIVIGTTLALRHYAETKRPRASAVFANSPPPIRAG